MEIQMARTGAGLRELGHTVEKCERLGRDEGFDLLHAFGAEPDAWHFLSHWRINRTPLVVSPVVVVSPGIPELILRVESLLPIKTGGRMKAEVVRQADALVVPSQYERRIVTRALGADGSKTFLIPNGAEPFADPPERPLEAVPDGPFVLMVGTVSRRKRQADVLRAVAGVSPVVVAGGFDGTAAERSEWEEAVRSSGAIWLGEVRDRGRIAELQRTSAALIHFSGAEAQSLGVMETLAAGTPVLLSDIPSHRELQEAYPEYVRIARSPGELPALVRPLLSERPDAPPPAVPTWSDVARWLEEIYRRVLAGSGERLRQ